MTATTETDPNVVTDARAAMLVAHAIYVQGGFSTAEIEKARAEKQLAGAPGSIDWDVMQAEVDTAIAAKIAAMLAPADPAPAPTATAPAEVRKDVTAVLASVDQGEALRDRIKALTADLKIHEDNIKDALGEATTGVDAGGKTVVRYPFRNRSGLSKEKVKDLLTPAQYADCETVTEYRSLLYGEG
jgi:hypothetical protein